MPENEVVLTSLRTLLTELMDGAGETGWMLNPGDAGLLRSLDRLSAADASAIAPGGASVAAHVDHLRYGLSLLNRWQSGEEPFADSDYSASWTRLTVSDEEWRARLSALRAELDAWRTAIAHPRDGDLAAFNTIISSIIHLGYHMGAIRQIERSTRGPAARD